MAGKVVPSIIHFPDVDKIDWISNNFINSRGGSFVAPITDNVTEFMPVSRGDLKNRVFGPALEEEPAIFVCRKIFIDNGVRYGVIDCSIRTVKYTELPSGISVGPTFHITAGNGGDDGLDPSVTVTAVTPETVSNTEKLFRIIDQDSVHKTITYIDA